MINAVKARCCKDNLVQLKCPSSSDHIIIGTEEIIFLKKNNEVLVNKYEKHPKRNSFEDSKFVSEYGGNCEQYSQLFEYDKLYLDFRKIRGSFELTKKYLFKGSNRALYLNEELDTTEKLVPYGKREEKVLSRREVEEVLNPNNYDSMYVVDVYGDIVFAANKKDGFIVGSRLVPSNNEIVKLELEKTKIDRKVAASFNYAFLGKSYTPLKLRNKLIDDINNFDIYAPINPGRFFNHILITSKDGEFKVQHFNLKFLKINSFRLITNEIFCLKPTVDDVINYTAGNKNEIRDLDDPYEIPEVVWDSRYLQREVVLSDDDYITKVGEEPWKLAKRLSKKK